MDLKFNHRKEKKNREKVGSEKRKATEESIGFLTQPLERREKIIILCN